MARHEIVKTGTYGIVRRGKTGPVVTSRLTQVPPADAVLLDTGEYVPAGAFNALPESEQAYLMKHGVDAYNKERAGIAERKIRDIEPFKTEGGYDLAGMVAAGYTKPQLVDLGFEAKAVSEAQSYHKATQQLAPYETREGYDLAAALEGGVSKSTLTTLFGKSAVDKAHEYRVALDAVADFKGPDGYDLVAAVKARVSPETLIQLFGTKAVDEAHMIVGRGEGRPAPGPAVTVAATHDMVAAPGAVGKKWYQYAWEYLTPWQEDKGETFTQYLKRQTIDQKVLQDPRDPESQAYLQELHTGYMALPWYLRMLINMPAVTVTDKTTGETYLSPVISSPAPLITPVPAGAAKTGTKVLEKAITRTQYNRLAESLRNLPKVAPKLADPKKMAEIVRKWPVKPVVRLPKVPTQGGAIRLPRIQPTFQPPKAAPGFTYNAWTGRYEPILQAVKATQARTLADIGLKQVGNRLVPITQKAIAGAPATLTRTVPMVVPVPDLRKAPSLGIVAYKVYTPDLADPILVPVKQANVKLTPEVREAIDKMLKTQSKAEVLAALGVQEISRAQTGKWLTLHEALAQAMATQVAQHAAIQAMTEGQTEAQARTKAQDAVATDPDVQAMLEPMTQAQANTITQGAVNAATAAAGPVQPTGARPGKQTGRRRPPRRGRFRLPGGDAGDDDKGKRQTYPKGTITWKMGRFWKIIPPPYNQPKPITAKRPPVGVKAQDGTPQETLAFVGGKVPDRDISFDLGVTDGYIDVSKRRILFTGKGMVTNVGKRIKSHTKGLSIPASQGFSTRKQGRVYVTTEAGSGRVALSRHNPNRRRP